MQRRVFLHVGMPKCATTTIQAVLFRQQDRLRDLGISYDMPAVQLAQSQGNAADLAIAAYRERSQAVSEALDFFLRGEGDVVLSAEGLSGLYKSAVAINLVRDLRARGAEVYVIAVFRRQDHWLESDFKQHVKGGQTWSGSIGELLEKRLQQDVLNYALFALYWSKYVGRDRVFSTVILPGSPRRYPVNFVLEQIGAADLCYADDAAVPMANVSPPTGLIEPARLLKQEMRAAGCSVAQIDAALNRFFAEAPGVVEVPKRRFLLPFAEREQLVERWKNSNRDLERRAGHHLAFDVEIDQDPASEVPLDEEARAVLEVWHTQAAAVSARDGGSRPGFFRRLFRG
ncbi:hypothetical protein [Roseovarius sp.]|uniref:hypothetical protein n=1 Tax=Roseovarius sp. TaxID=1486281 RepID=UPI003A97B9F7